MSTVRIPEQEAIQLTRSLRHHPELVGFGISVYAYISQDGTRALHVAVDRSDRGGSYNRYDLRYKADTDMTRLVTNAVKRIKAKFDGA